MNKRPTNSDDMIDSRDVIEAIRELEHEEEEDNGDELRALKKLAEQAEDYSPDWRHGAQLIRDSYFKEYAQEFAEDVYGSRNDQWPYTCIDWDQAAKDLQVDYIAVEFSGVAYWIQ